MVSWNDINDSLINHFFRESCSNYLDYQHQKNFIGYFPIDLIKDLFILLYFQEQCGRIYDSYISSIKDQNLLVSFFRELIY